jgi:hypothetical protein
MRFLISILIIALISACTPSPSWQSHVIWHVPEYLSPLWFFPHVDPGTPYEKRPRFDEGSTKYAKVATMSGGAYDGDEVIRVVSPPHDLPYSQNSVMHFVHHNDAYLAIPEIAHNADDHFLLPEGTSTGIYEWPNDLREAFSGIFIIPDRIISSGGTAHLMQRTAVDFSPAHLIPVAWLSESLSGQVWIEMSGALWEKSDPDNPEHDTGRFFQTEALYMRLPDNTTAIYMADIPFLDAKNNEKVPHITWNDGSENTESYFWNEWWHMCGPQRGSFGTVVRGSIQMMSREQEDLISTGYPNAVETSIDIPYSDTDLIEIGRTDSWESIRSFRDKDHPVLKNFYMKPYTYMQEVFDPPMRTLPYEKFVRAVPLFFYRDTLGRDILFVNSRFYFQDACGAKPIIYLYPEKTERISVQLDTSRKAFISAPLYRHGWDIMVEPDGRITDIFTKREYPYLFWEDVLSYPTPLRGWIVSREDVPAFLREKLTHMGLNEKEQQDFLDYWLPHMQSESAYRISFLQDKDMNRIAPLHINPKPDSIIRVFMDFSPASDPSMHIESQILTQGKRSGYSVIEWGGKLWD